METLQRYWHWHRNERPNAQQTAAMRAKHLSPLAEHALALAAGQIAARRSTLDVEAQNDALAELSVEFCRALEKMHSAVAEGPAPTTRDLDARWAALLAGRRAGKSVLPELLDAETRKRIEDACRRPSPVLDRLRESVAFDDCVGVTAAHLAAHGR